MPVKRIIVAVVVGAACSASGGAGQVLDVSQGMHEVVEGDVYDYVVARGDAQMTISGGDIVSFSKFPVSEEEGGVYSMMRASVLAEDRATLRVTGGRVDGVVLAMGTSQVTVSAETQARGYFANERGALTIDGAGVPPEGRADVGAVGSGRVWVRGGEFDEVGASDHGVAHVSGGDFERALVFHGGTIEVAGGVFQSRIVAEKGGVVRIIDGFHTVEVHAYDDLDRGGLSEREDSKIEIIGGSIPSAFSSSDDPLLMTGGEVRELISASRVHISGGTIGDRVVVSEIARFDVRSLELDRDGDPDTPGAPVPFDQDGLIVFEVGDERLIERGESGEEWILGVSVVWRDWSEARFDIQVRTDLPGVKRLEFHRAATPQDLDGDGRVGASDLAILLSEFGQAGNADYTGDDVVDMVDLAILLNVWRQQG